jgi:hypothetical protein
MDAQRPAAVLIAERTATVQRILALESLARAARFARKNRTTIDAIKTEVQSLHGRVRQLNGAIKKPAQQDRPA